MSGDVTSDRSVPAGDVSRSVIVTGDGNRVSLVFGDNEVVLPLVRRQVPAPDRRRRLEPREARRELDVLVADRRAAPLVGRDELLAGLVAWLEDDIDISVRALIGRAGSGKTRLAIELCRAVDGGEAVGAWAAGFLPPAELAAAVEALATRSFDWERPTLLILDYAAQVQGALARWLDRLVTQGRLTGRLRLLLLEREAPEGFGWWKELTTPASSAGAQRTDLFWDTDLRPEELPGLEELEDRRQVLAATLAASAALRGTAAPAAIPTAGADPGFDAALAGARFSNPLSLMMAGLLALDQPPREALALRRLDAARHLAARELRRLGDLGGAGNAAAMRHLAAFNGLAGGLAIAGLRETLAGELAAAGIAGDVARVATLLQQELPAPPEAAAQTVPHLGTVQPDLVGEGLIVEALSGEPTVEAGAATLAARAYGVAPERAGRALMQLLQDYAYALEDAAASEEEKTTARRLMGWLTELAGAVDDPEALEALAFALPAETLVLREEALRLTEWLAEAFKAAYRASNDPETGARAAVWLNNLGNRLSALGQLEAALAAAEEAVDLYRGLAAARPDAFSPALAGSLNNLGNWLSALGQREAALAVVQEAVDLCRRLAAARPGALNPDLAMSLNNLGIRHSAIGHHETALAAAEEAADLYRRLAADRPHAFTGDLASSLNNLGNFLSDLGRHEAALVAAQEAVDLRRELAAARPDAFTPALASSLNNLGNSLSALGQDEAALAAAREAVDLRRGLATARPDTFTPDLAMSLSNLGNWLSTVGQHEAALAAAQQAVDLYRRLAADLPDAFTPDLARSLSNLGNWLSALGQHELALAVVKEAVDLRRRLAAAWPDAFTVDLSVSLGALADVHRAAGDPAAARDTFSEAIILLRPVFLAVPQATAQLMVMHLRRYYALGEELGLGPDVALVGSIFEALERLQPGGGEEDEH